MSELEFIVQPPKEAKAHNDFNPPIAVKLPGLRSEDNGDNPFPNHGAIAEYRTAAGSELKKFDSSFGSKAYPLPKDQSFSSSGSGGAYFYFPHLHIDEPGEYCIRIAVFYIDPHDEIGEKRTPVGVVETHITIKDESDYRQELSKTAFVSLFARWS